MAQRAKRILRCNHLAPGGFRMGYILLPYGYLYNNAIAEAKKGDTLRFLTGEDHKIFAVRKVKFNSAETDLLCRIRYGVPKEGVMQRWKTNALIDGNGENAISDDECLFVVYDEDSV